MDRRCPLRQLSSGSGRLADARRTLALRIGTVDPYASRDPRKLGEAVRARTRRSRPRAEEPGSATVHAAPEPRGAASAPKPKPGRPVARATASVTMTVRDAGQDRRQIKRLGLAPSRARASTQGPGRRRTPGPQASDSHPQPACAGQARLLAASREEGGMGFPNPFRFSTVGSVCIDLSARMRPVRPKERQHSLGVVKTVRGELPEQ